MLPVDCMSSDHSREITDLRAVTAGQTVPDRALLESGEFQAGEMVGAS